VRLTALTTGLSDDASAPDRGSTAARGRLVRATPCARV